ncbi:acyl-CoA dehydrogenase family protein [Geminicoccus flavidas]|uniref:acyl-CoA dehydrogenase family protein n=1 Tax=Geminicoccus flavidas TaxID=2506407 RepID=UPI0013589C00|nr:acyl-CoA dehydrogenase family protein [Geminicoccus flavidas]
MSQALLQAVEQIKPIIAEHAQRAEADRRLSDVVYEAMHQAGLFGMHAPKAHGGLELHPVDAMQIYEAIARIDSSAAWNLLMNQGISAYAAWLPAEGARELFRDGPPATAGAFNPPAAATRAEGGWRITGRVPFASGCHNAQWLAMPAVEMDDHDQPKVDPTTGMPKVFGAFFPRADAQILDTWHTLGMRGTGSADIAVRDLFVPDQMTAPVGPLRHPAPGFEGPLFRLWPWTNILSEATVSVGIAAEALDQGTRLCTTKTAAYNAMPLREQQLVQYQMGKARARVEASRDTLHRAASAAYDEVAESGAGLTADGKIRLQLAVCFAAEACAEAVRLVTDSVGTAAIRLEEPFQRHLRDAHVLLQHSSKSAARYASAGRLMFGLENDWVWLSF